MGRRLYVGNLAYGTTDVELREMFSGAGTCESATVMIDRATGRSRGFGFVEMSTDEEAQRAIAEYNGKDLQGRSLTVNEAREKSAGGGRRPGFVGGGGFGRDEGGGGFGYDAQSSGPASGRKAEAAAAFAGRSAASSPVPRRRPDQAAGRVIPSPGAFTRPCRRSAGASGRPARRRTPRRSPGSSRAGRSPGTSAVSAGRG